jgi:hypothetical protein
MSTPIVMRMRLRQRKLYLMDWAIIQDRMLFKYCCMIMNKEIFAAAQKDFLAQDLKNISDLKKRKSANADFLFLITV